MLLINDCFMTHTFTPKIQEFLAMLKQKAASGKHAHGGFQEASLDELYGILPPLELKWYMAPDKKYHRQIREWGLTGVLEIDNDWDRLHMVLWNHGNKFHGVHINLLETELTILNEPVFLPRLFIDIFRQAEKRLQLLYSAFTNPLLKVVGVRKYINDLILSEADLEKRNFLLEVCITLLCLKLEKDEETNLEYFQNRARHYIQNMIRYRVEAAVASATVRQIAGVMALRGGMKLEEELLNPISMIWGFQVNQDFYRDEIEKSPEPACFYEKYYTNGRVDIGEILPVVSSGEKSEMISRPRCDLYKQVFPDYETAMICRNVALGILRHNKKHNQEESNGTLSETGQPTYR